MEKIYGNGLVGMDNEAISIHCLQRARPQTPGQTPGGVKNNVNEWKRGGDVVKRPIATRPLHLCLVHSAHTYTHTHAHKVSHSVSHINTCRCSNVAPRVTRCQ